LDKPGPYEVVARLHERSAQLTYCLSLVLSGTWWVNSDADFDPDFRLSPGICLARRPQPTLRTEWGGRDWTGRHRTGRNCARRVRV